QNVRRLRTRSRGRRSGDHPKLRRAAKPRTCQQWTDFGNLPPCIEIYVGPFEVSPTRHDVSHRFPRAVARLWVAPFCELDVVEHFWIILHRNLVYGAKHEPRTMRHP